MSHNTGSRRKKENNIHVCLAISADDFTEQEAPIVAIVSLPTAKDANELKSNGNGLINIFIWIHVLTLFLCLDDLLGKFVETVEGKVQNDYAVIYTSSAAKVRGVFSKGFDTERLTADSLDIWPRK